MTTDRFEIRREDDSLIWAHQERGAITIYRTDLRSGRDTALLTLERDAARRLLMWADGDRGVTASITGPLAREVRKSAEELSLTPEVFVWEAVKVFLETARDASHGH